MTMIFFVVSVLRLTELDHFFVSFNYKVCGDFLAGDALRSRSRYSALSETAIFGRACRHEFPKKFVNMKHGER